MERGACIAILAFALVTSSFPAVGEIGQRDEEILAGGLDREGGEEWALGELGLDTNRLRHDVVWDPVLPPRDGDQGGFGQLLTDARAANDWQAALLGAAGTWDVSPRFSSLGEAIDALPGDRASSRTASNAMADLDSLPEPVNEALRSVLEAFVGLRDATNRAYEGVPRSAFEKLETGRWLDHHQLPTSSTDFRPTTLTERTGLQVGAMLEARGAFLEAVGELRKALGSHDGRIGQPAEAQIPGEFVIDLSHEDDVYTEDTLLTIDAGGNDTYRTNAGGNGVQSIRENPCRPDNATTAALVDLGNGSDTYGDREAPRSCGVNGGAIMGVGMLVDGGGDDVFVARTDAVNGGGNVGGLGFLLDGDGDDRYLAGVEGHPSSCLVSCSVKIDTPLRTVSVPNTCSQATCDIGSRGVNGGGDIGVGLLVDGGGSDRYLAGADALIEECGWLFSHCRIGSGGVNGGGNNGGLGTLLDRSGDDWYLAGIQSRMECRSGFFCSAASWGVNGGASNGVGVLRDRGGADVYRAGANVLVACDFDCPVGQMGVNGGALDGLASIHDDGGDDRYEVGISVHIHECSHDCDVGSRGINGGADIGAGLVWDRQGDDRYEAGINSTLFCDGEANCDIGGDGVNGGGTLGGSGTLLDESGQDAYLAGHNSTVAACRDDGYCSIGSRGANGGGYVGGSGALLDLGGRDRYLAGVNSSISCGLEDSCDRARWGANGGTGSISAFSAANATGLLLDVNSEGDVYRDGRTACEDCSKVPKGRLGAQIDRDGLDAISATPASEEALGLLVPFAR